jgi:3-methyl-2-oxobutanoate hydroxymethyltransferase
MRDMVYNTECVARAARRAFVIADMPFGSFQVSPQQAFENAALLMAAGAQMVKIEGGAAMVDTVSFLVERGVPVCAHIGLTPQSVHQLGGYRVQGRTDAAAVRLREEAALLEGAGAGMLLFFSIFTDRQPRPAGWVFLGLFVLSSLDAVLRVVWSVQEWLASRGR